MTIDQIACDLASGPWPMSQADRDDLARDIAAALRQQKIAGAQSMRERTAAAFTGIASERIRAIPLIEESTHG